MKGGELRAIRQQLGLTQVLFADELGLHPNSVAKLERGEMVISRQVEKFARLLLRVAQLEKREQKRNRK